LIDKGFVSSPFLEAVLIVRLAKHGNIRYRINEQTVCPYRSPTPERSS
jgi:hypothetical protein